MSTAARHRAEVTRVAVLRDVVGGLADAGVRELWRPRSADWPRRALIVLSAMSLAVAAVGLHDVRATAATLAPSTPAVVSTSATSTAVVPAVAATPVVYVSTSTVAPAVAARDAYDVTILPPPETPDRVSWPVPVGTAISSPFGPRVAPCPTCAAWHHGIDLVPGEGTPVAAIADGIVVEADAGTTSELGVHLTIRHAIHGQLVDSVYGHLLEGTMPLHVGDSVRRGQLVGLVGDTGESTGPHLHFGILLSTGPTDPVAWMAEHADR